MKPCLLLASESHRGWICLSMCLYGSHGMIPIRSSASTLTNVWLKPHRKPQQHPLIIKSLM